MTTEQAVCTLTLKNRAYQVLYALGDDWPYTLTEGQAACLVGIVQDIWNHQNPRTQLDDILRSKMSRRMLAYVAGEVA